MTATPASFPRIKQLMRLGFALTGIAGACATASAQLANPAATRVAATPSADEAITLEVFKVQETKGQSYGASNLASATRMNTPIENVP